MHANVRTLYFTTIFLTVLLTYCSGNVIFESEPRHQPSTGSILVNIAKELVKRSRNTNQVLNLNFSNLLFLMILKAVVFGANYIGFNDTNSRGFDAENIVCEEEISLALGYLIGDKCLYRMACEMPNTAKNYLDAIDIIIETLKLIPETISVNETHTKTIAEFRKAIEYGIVKQCPPEYNCEQKNMSNYLQPE